MCYGFPKVTSKNQERSLVVDCAPSTVRTPQSFQLCQDAWRTKLYSLSTRASPSTVQVSQYKSMPTPFFCGKRGENLRNMPPFFTHRNKALIWEIIYCSLHSDLKKWRIQSSSFQPFNTFLCLFIMLRMICVWEFVWCYLQPSPSMSSLGLRSISQNKSIHCTNDSYARPAHGTRGSRRYSGAKFPRVIPPAVAQTIAVDHRIYPGEGLDFIALRK